MDMYVYVNEWICRLHFFKMSSAEKFVLLHLLINENKLNVFKISVKNRCTCIKYICAENIVVCHYKQTKQNLKYDKKVRENNNNKTSISSSSYVNNYFRNRTIKLCVFVCLFVFSMQKAGICYVRTTAPQ